MPLFYYARNPAKFDRSEVFIVFRYIYMAREF